MNVASGYSLDHVPNGRTVSGLGNGSGTTQIDFRTVRQRDHLSTVNKYKLKYAGTLYKDRFLPNNSVSVFVGDVVDDSLVETIAVGVHSFNTCALTFLAPLVRQVADVVVDILAEFVSVMFIS